MKTCGSAIAQFPHYHAGDLLHRTDDARHLEPLRPLAVWTSIIPSSSPIVMGRVPFGVPNTVPIWQLALSMALLIGGFMLTTWFAARIYRHRHSHVW